MKLATKLVLMTCILALPYVAKAYSNGPEDGLTNSPPNRANCTGCHNTFGFNSGNGSLALEGLPNHYQPGETYRISLALADPNARRWGFELTVLNVDNARAGNLAVVNGNQTQLSNVNNRPQYLKHRSAGTFSGQANSASWEFDWTAPGEDIGTVTFFYVGNAANNNFGTSGDRIYGEESPLEVQGPPQADRFAVALMEGWNLISSPVAPGEVAVASIFAPLVESGALVVLRDSEGRIYDPARQVNQIGDWMTFSGYQIKVNRAAGMEFVGEFVDPSSEIELTEGWNWISLPRNDEIHPSLLLDALSERTLLVKDGAGRFAAPEFGLSNLGMITPGSGIKVKLHAGDPLQFVWPEADTNLEPPAALPQPRHFAAASNTGRSMNIGIIGWEMSNGDELEVRDVNGMHVGTGVVANDELIMAVWGDDNTTEEIDGTPEGTDVSFTYWIAEEDREVVVEGSFGEVIFVTYETDTFKDVALRLPNGIADESRLNPAKFALNGLYPNPFNARSEVAFTLPRAGEVKVSIFDASGKIMKDFGASTYPSGNHRFAINAENLPVGLYLVGVEFEGRRELTRALLLK